MIDLDAIRDLILFSRTRAEVCERSLGKDVPPAQMVKSVRDLARMLEILIDETHDIHTGPALAEKIRRFNGSPQKTNARPIGRASKQLPKKSMR